MNNFNIINNILRMPKRRYYTPPEFYLMTLYWHIESPKTHKVTEDTQWIVINLGNIWFAGNLPRSNWSERRTKHYYMETQTMT